MTVQLREAFEQSDPDGLWVDGTWIAPSTNQAYNGTSYIGGSLPGYYTYTTTFWVDSGDVGLAELAGSWSTDNSGVMYLNGHQITTLDSTPYRTPSATSYLNTSTKQVRRNDSSHGLGPITRARAYAWLIFKYETGNSLKVLLISS